MLAIEWANLIALSCKTSDAKMIGKLRAKRLRARKLIGSIMCDRGTLAFQYSCASFAKGYMTSTVKTKLVFVCTASNVCLQISGQNKMCD